MTQNHKGIQTMETMATFEPTKTLLHGDIHILPSERRGNGDFSVAGNVTIGGRLKIGDIEIANNIMNKVQCLEEDNRRLNSEIATLKDVVNMLWYSPGMPGYQLSEEHWKDKLSSNNTRIERTKR